MEHKNTQFSVNKLGGHETCPPDHSRS